MEQVQPSEAVPTKKRGGGRGGRFGRPSLEPHNGGRAAGAHEVLAYKINDAVKVAGLSRTSIYKAIAAGKLASVVVAGRRLIPATALRRFLQLEAA